MATKFTGELECGDGQVYLNTTNGRLLIEDDTGLNAPQREAYNELGCDGTGGSCWIIEGNRQGDVLTMTSATKMACPQRFAGKIELNDERQSAWLVSEGGTRMMLHRGADKGGSARQAAYAQFKKYPEPEAGITVLGVLSDFGTPSLRIEAIERPGEAS